MSGSFAKRKRSDGGGGGGKADSRFAAMHSNPTFSRPKKGSEKVKLDDRFKAVLTDERFRVGEGGKVDKYGRRKKGGAEESDGKRSRKKGGGSNGGGELSKYYKFEAEEEQEREDEEDESVSSEEEDGGEEEARHQAEATTKRANKKGKELAASSHRESIEDRVDYLNKMARGEISGESSSSSEDEDSDDGGDPVAEGALSSDEGDEEEEEIPTGDAYARLAIQDCDWHNMKAVDLLALCQSFCPPGESVLRCAVYPSDYGLSRFEEEERHGPIAFLREVEKRLGPRAGSAAGGMVTERRRPGIIVDTSSDGKKKDDGEDQGFSPEVLRAYEEQKRKYYFAIVECSSIEAASAVYSELDGMEFESSSIRLDLRFVPDEVSFSGRELRDEASNVPTDYSVPGFIFKALQQSKVECTWDEADEDRKKLIPGTGRWGETREDEFEAYLDSSGDEDDSCDEEQSRAKIEWARRALLAGLVNDDDEEEVEGGEDSEEHTVIDGARALEKKKKKKKKKEEEEEVEKESKGKKGKRSAAIADSFFLEEEEEQEGNNGSNGEDDDGDEEEAEDDVKGKEKLLSKIAKQDEEKEEDIRDYDMVALQREEKMKGKKLRGRRKRKEQSKEKAVGGGFKVNVQDERFAAVLQGGDGRFGIDRTAPEFKETDGMRDILDSQRKFREKDQQRGRERYSSAGGGGGGAAAADKQVSAEVSGTHVAKEGIEALSSLVNRLKAKSANRKGATARR